MSSPGPTTIALEVLRTDADLVAFAPQWRELAAASLRPELMLGPEWLGAWWQIYGQDRELCVGVYRDGPRVVGLAPMQRRIACYRPGLRFRRLEWLGADVDENDGVCSDYLHLVVLPGYETAVCERYVADVVARAYGTWDEWILSAVDGTHPLNEPLRASWEKQGYRPAQRNVTVSPYWPMPASWDDYLKSLNKKKRQSFVYALRDFERWADGAWEERQATDAVTLAEGMTILKDLHRERWSPEGGSGAFGSRRFDAFHESYAALALANGSLDLSWLTVRGKPVAAQYSFVLGTKCYYYQTGRITEVPTSVRLGIVQLALLAKRRMAQGTKELDFLAGPAQYKRLFSSDERPVLEFRVARRTVREGIRQLTRKAADTMRSWRGKQVLSPTDENSAFTPDSGERGV